MNYLKHPVALLLYIGAILLILSGFFDWISFSADWTGDFIAAAVSDLLAIKMLIVLILGLIILVLGILGAWKGKRGLSVVNLILASVALSIIVTAYVSGSNAELLGIQGMAFGYYFAISGTAIIFITSILALFKFKGEKTSIAPVPPQGEFYFLLPHFCGNDLIWS